MVDIESILQYYPQAIRDNLAFHKHILKEHVELLALEHLSRSAYASAMVFIGGTCLRLVHGIDRFSEDLDFDCKGIGADEFRAMTDSLVHHLRAMGFDVETRDRNNSNLTAFRRNLYFPGLLFDMRLTGHREERFLMKVEAQDQGIPYTPQTVVVDRCGFLFPISVPPKDVLLSMKLSALLTRAKGRDFYDTIFLWQQVQPDYDFLSYRCGVSNDQELKVALQSKLAVTNMADKQRDFEHLLFAPERSRSILHFDELVNRL